MACGLWSHFTCSGLVVGVSLGVYQLITRRNHSCSPLRTAPHRICPSTCWWVRGSLPFLAVRSKASVIIPVHVRLFMGVCFLLLGRDLGVTVL